VEYGRIVEGGRRDELLACSGLSSQLYAKGLLGVSEEAPGANALARLIY
jgi:hypothetical protein